jgi:hypothetical protein
MGVVMTNENPAFPPKPNREQLENSVKALSNFQTAVNAGTYPGSACIHIAALQDLLRREHDAALKLYESEANLHPEWGGGLHGAQS